MKKYQAVAIVFLLVLSLGAFPANYLDGSKYNHYQSKLVPTQTVTAKGKEVNVARGLGIYIPSMIYPVGRYVPVTSGFGYRTAPCATCSSNHEGLDFNPGYGTPVYSATDGTVIWVGMEGSLGYHVVIADAGTWQLYYGHMIDGSAPSSVIIGSTIKKGDLIGKVGSTGQSTGAHLHFAIQDGTAFVDPYPLLQKYAE